MKKSKRFFLLSLCVALLVVFALPVAGLAGSESAITKQAARYQAFSAMKQASKAGQMSQESVISGERDLMGGTLHGRCVINKPADHSKIRIGSKTAVEIDTQNYAGHVMSVGLFDTDGKVVDILFANSVIKYSSSRKSGVWDVSGYAAGAYQIYVFISNAATQELVDAAWADITLASASKRPVTGIKLNAKSKTLLAGQKFALKAAVAPSNATNKSIAWTSSNSKIATVSSKGVVTAKKAGTVTITAKAKDGSGKKAVCKVAVKQPVKKISIKPTSAKIKVKMQYPLTVKVEPGDATSKALVWKSSNTKIVKVSSKGVLLGVRKGTAYVSATAKDGSKVTCKIKVTVR